MTVKTVLEGLDLTDQNPLRRWRKEQGLSVWAAAARIGVSDSTVKTWEAGGQMPGLDRFERLAELMGYASSITLLRAWEAWRKQMRGK